MAKKFTPAQQRVLDLVGNGYTVQRAKYFGRFGKAGAKCWKRDEAGGYTSERVSDATLEALVIAGAVKTDRDGVLHLV